MIIIEQIENGERERRYSDENMKLRQIETGNIYEDAVDVIPCRYTYEETDIPIEEINEKEYEVNNYAERY